MAQPLVDDVTKTVRDALYVGVGFGVIAFQKAQVQRHEATKALQTQLGEAKTQFQHLTTNVEDQVKGLEERLEGVEERLEGLLDQVEAKLPTQAQDAVKQARTVAKDAQSQLRGLVRQNGNRRAA